VHKAIGLLLLLSGCALAPGEDALPELIEPEIVPHIEVCPVVTPERVDEAWDAPVVSAWPKDYNPTVNMLVGNGLPSCTPEQVLPQLKFWCDNLGICMKLQYISSIPEEKDYVYGNIYVSVESELGQAGLTEWRADRCHGNHHARMRLQDCRAEVLTHELGHALGFMHSSNAFDIMFPTVTTNEIKISTRAVAAYRVAQGVE
jgi:hypothetical protein